MSKIWKKRFFDRIYPAVAVTAGVLFLSALGLTVMIDKFIVPLEPSGGNLPLPTLVKWLSFSLIALGLFLGALSDKFFAKVLTLMKYIIVILVPILVLIGILS